MIATVRLVFFLILIATVTCQEPSCSRLNFLEHLLEKLVRMEVRMDTMQTQLDASENAVDTKVPETIDDARPTNVAFTVMAKTTRLVYQRGQIIVFDAEITNQGNCYDINTGLFTAPVAGTYFFQVNIRSDNDAEVWGHIDVNDETKAWFNARGTDGRHGMGSQSLILILNKGDTVAVRNNSNGAKYYGVNYCTFSGYMLYKTSV